MSKSTKRTKSDRVKVKTRETRHEHRRIEQAIQSRYTARYGATITHNNDSADDESLSISDGSTDLLGGKADSSSGK